MSTAADDRLQSEESLVGWLKQQGLDVRKKQWGIQPAKKVRELLDEVGAELPIFSDLRA